MISKNRLYRAFMSIEAILIKALLKFLEAVFYRAFMSIEAVLSFSKPPLYADFFVVRVTTEYACNLPIKKTHFFKIECALFACS
jgi:hypothetical protein